MDCYGNNYNKARNNHDGNIEGDMDCFAKPVTNAPMPRWERKALEASSAQGDNLVGGGLNKTPSKRTPARPTKRQKTPNHDRFIPNRSAMDMDVCRHALSLDGKENGGAFGLSGKEESAYSSILTASLLDKPASSFFGHATGSCSSGGANGASVSSSALSGSASSSSDLLHSKILAFSDKAPAQREGYLNANRVLFSQGGTGAGASRRHKFRHIASKPEKILDAPNLLEDFYLNLVDWGSNNVLAVALGEAVYLWHADTGSIDQLCETTAYDDCVTSVKWIPGGNYLAVGTNAHEVQIWDASQMKQLRTMRSHRARVGSLAWNSHLLSSGARDGSIHHHDVRVPRHHVASLLAHSQEVCGLVWSPNGAQLASGANDNTVCVWDAFPSLLSHHQSQSSPSSAPSVARPRPRHVFTAHTAAVKALAWCPWQTNLLATGGGTADRHLRFWNTASGVCVNAVDTKSQVCSIVWSPHDKELLTSHGFSQNQLTLWKYPSLARMAELKGHTSRVLHTSLSPDGQTVVSGAADETLRFWKVFADSDASKSRADPHSTKGPLSSNIRSVNNIRWKEKYLCTFFFFFLWTSFGNLRAQILH